MHRSVVVAFLLFAGGCAGSFGIASTEGSKVIQQAKTIGVISAVGHKFALQKIGITVFGNELNHVAIDSWGIDDVVVGKIGDLLGKRYAVEKIASPKDHDGEPEKLVRGVGASQKYDLYIVVTRTGVPFSSTNQILSGLGMVEVGGALYRDHVLLFAVTTVHVYDGRTLERLVWQRSGHEVGLQLNMVDAINAPHRRLDRSWWPATPQDIHSAKLKTATRALVEEGLAKTIPAILEREPAKQAEGK
jgi:hypothetical protein